VIRLLVLAGALVSLAAGLVRFLHRLG